MLRLFLLLCALVTPAAADVYVWVDDQGQTFITDDPDGVPEDHRERGIPEGGPVGRLWGDPGEIPSGPVPPSQSNDRVSRTS